MLAFLVTLGAAGWWAMQEWKVRHTPVPTSPLVPRDLTRLTIDPGLQTDVTWSPDGKSIAYASDKAGNFDIWMQRLDGGDAIQLTKSPSQDREPAWSPDGTTIVFRSDRDGGGLFVVPAGGGAERRLTSFGVGPSGRLMALKSCSGRPILTSTPHLYTVRLDGRPPQQVLQSFLKHLTFMATWNWYPDSQRVSVLGAGGNFLGPLELDGIRYLHGPIVRWSASSAEIHARTGDSGATSRGRPQGEFSMSIATATTAHNIGRLTVDPQTMTILTAERVTAGDGWETRLAPSSDGRHLAFTMSRMSQRLWAFPFDAATGRMAGNGEPVTDDRGPRVRHQR